MDLNKHSKSYGLYLASITGGVAALISFVAIPFVSPALRKICLPYVPATDVQISNVLKALQNRSGALIDLGSGDGRIVIATAKEKRFQATGIELNRVLVWYSRFLSRRYSVHRNCSFLCKDLWKFQLSPYQNIVIFGVEQMMDQLEEKLNKELEDGTVVVACRFPLPAWKPVATIGVGIDTVWLYEKQSQRSSS